MKENLPINKAEKSIDAQRKNLEIIGYKALEGYSRVIHENLPSQEAEHFKSALRGAK